MTHKGYAEKWRKRMTEAYRIANNNSLSSSAKGKSYYDQKARGVILKPGDRVLVRNVGERGGPGKLHSYWEERIYVVKEQVSDNPVYVIHPESGNKGKPSGIPTPAYQTNLKDNTEARKPSRKKEGCERQNF